MYTYEVLNNDRSIFVLNEPIRIINNLIYKLEVIIIIYYILIFKYKK